jgi:signal transduction histidine kinase
MLLSVRRSVPAFFRVILGSLFLSFVLAGVLAYEAYRGERSHRQTTDGVLKDYAGVAAWQLSRSAEEEFRMGIRAVFRPLVQAQAQGAAGGGLPAVSILNPARENATSCGCPVADSIHQYFRLDLPERRLTTACGASPNLARTRSVDTVVAHAQRVYQPNWDFATLFVGGREGAQAVTYTLVRDARGELVAVYGFKAPVEAFGGPVFRRLLRETSLLPGALTSGAPNDSLLAVSITTLAGDTVFRSAVRYAPRFVATDTLDGPFGGMLLHIAINPAMAERLLIGGIPRSGLPRWLAILVLNAILIGVAFRQMGREREIVQTRSRFLSRIAHELRVPLSEIRVYAEMLRLGRVRSDAERMRSIEIIDQQSMRLAHLVDNVLHFSHSRLPTYKVQPEPTEIAHEVRTIVEAFAPLAVSRRVEIQLDLIAEGVVSVDRGALHQILLNLLDNALKYGRPDQIITVGLLTSGQSMRLWVDDQGPGIAPVDRARIFEPFFRQAPAAASASVQGNGIGLAVVRELVIMHEGAVWVEDAPGGGARFVVELWRSQSTVHIGHLDVPHLRRTADAEEQWAQHGGSA